MIQMKCNLVATCVSGQMMPGVFSNQSTGRMFPTAPKRPNSPISSAVVQKQHATLATKQG